MIFSSGVFSEFVLAENRISWEQCAQEANQKNLTLKKAMESIKKSEIQLDAIKQGFLPQLSASTSANRNAADSASSAPAQDDSSKLQYNNDFSYGLNLKQSIFSGFKDAIGRDKKRVELEITKLDLEKTMAEVTYNLRSTFLQLIYWQELRVITKDIMKRREENLRIVSMRFKGGRENKGSLMKSEANLAQAQFESADVEKNLVTTKMQLGQMIGLEKTDDLKVSGSFETKLTDTAPNLEQLVANTPTYKKSLATEKVSEYGITLARASYYPEISATASANKTGDSWPPDQNRFSVGLSLSLPLYSGGSTFNDVQAAMSDKIQAETDTINTQHDQLIEIRKAYVMFEETIKKNEVQESLLKATETQATIARNQYALGLVTFQEWDNIEGELNTQKKNLLTSKKDAALAEAAWKKTIGKGF